MARAKLVKKAQKDYPEQGIKKGESYYWWKFRFGGKHYSKTMPKRSQLTQSSFLGQVWEVEDEMSSYSPDELSSVDSDLADFKERLQEAADESQNSLDNMPEGLQQGDTGEMLQNRVDEIESMISELDSIDIDELEKEQDESDDDFEQRVEDKKQEIADAVQGIQYGGE